MAVALAFNLSWQVRSKRDLVNLEFIEQPADRAGELARLSRVLDGIREDCPALVFGFEVHTNGMVLRSCNQFDTLRAELASRWTEPTVDEISIPPTASLLKAKAPSLNTTSTQEIARNEDSGSKCPSVDARRHGQQHRHRPKKVRRVYEREVVMLRADTCTLELLHRLLDRHCKVVFAPEKCLLQLSSYSEVGLNVASHIVDRLFTSFAGFGFANMYCRRVKVRSSAFKPSHVIRERLEAQFGVTITGVYHSDDLLVFSDICSAVDTVVADLEGRTNTAYRRTLETYNYPVGATGLGPSRKAAAAQPTFAQQQMLARLALGRQEPGDSYAAAGVPEPRQPPQRARAQSLDARQPRMPRLGPVQGSLLFRPRPEAVGVPLAQPVPTQQGKGRPGREQKKGKKAQQLAAAAAASQPRRVRAGSTPPANVLSRQAAVPAVRPPQPPPLPMPLARPMRAASSQAPLMPTRQTQLIAASSPPPPPPQRNVAVPTRTAASMPGSLQLPPTDAIDYGRHWASIPVGQFSSAGASLLPGSSPTAALGVRPQTGKKRKPRQAAPAAVPAPARPAGDVDYAHASQPPARLPSIVQAPQPAGGKKKKMKAK